MGALDECSICARGGAALGWRSIAAADLVQSLMQVLRVQLLLVLLCVILLLLLLLLLLDRLLVVVLLLAHVQAVVRHRVALRRYHRRRLRHRRPWVVGLRGCRQRPLLRGRRR